MPTDMKFVLKVLLLFIFFQMILAILVAVLHPSESLYYTLTIAANLFIYFYLRKKLSTYGYQLGDVLKKNVGRSLMTAFLLYPVETFILMLLNIILPVSYKGVYMLTRSEGGFSIWLLVISAVILGPIVEEVAFRGVIYPSLKVRMKPELAVILSSALFAFLHPLEIFPHILVLSVFLVYAYELAGSVLASVFLHVLNNGMSLLFMIMLGE